MQRVVVLRALGLGDLLTAVPALRALRRRHDSAVITALLPAQLAPLALATGAVDAVEPADGLDARPKAELRRPEIAVNLHGSGPRSHRLLLDLRPRSLVAFGNAEVGVRGPDWWPDEHEVRRWCRLVEAAGCAADPHDLLVDVPRAAAVLQDAVVEGATVLHPGAKSGARRWPVDRWTAVAAAETAAGRTVVVSGTESERRLVERIVTGPAVDRTRARALVGADIMTFATTIRAAGRVLCGDTGVAHLATALGRPSVLLFGPSSPARWGPLRDPERHIVLWSGRVGNPLADTVDAGLLEVTVDDVLGAVSRLPAVA
jgi:ADP-heptose:LPS heptosyltransferase